MFAVDRPRDHCGLPRELETPRALLDQPDSGEATSGPALPTRPDGRCRGRDRTRCRRVQSPSETFNISRGELMSGYLARSGACWWPMVTEMAGSSTVMRGNVWACAVSASCRIMISGAAKATMSPGDRLRSVRSNALGDQQLGDLALVDGTGCAHRALQETCCLFDAALVDPDQSQSAEERRSTRRGWSQRRNGASGSTAGRMCSANTRRVGRGSSLGF